MSRSTVRTLIGEFRVRVRRVGFVIWSYVPLSGMKVPRILRRSVGGAVLNDRVNGCR